MIQACIPSRPSIPPSRAGSRRRLGEPTPPQREGWPRDPRGAAHADRRADRARARRSRRSSRRSTRCSARGRSCPTRRRSSTSRRCGRSPTTSRRTSRARWPRSAPSDPFLPEVRVLVRTGDTPSARARRDDAAAAAHPGHDARVALHPAHERRRARACCAPSAPSSSTRSTRSCATSAAATSRSRSSGSRRWPRPPGPAHRPLGHAEAARRSRPLPRGRGPRVRARRRRAPSATLDLAIEIPPSPLSTVCSHEQWEEIYARMADLDRASTARRSSSSTRARWPSASRRSSRRLLGEDAVTQPPRQPLAGAAARRRGAPEGRQAARARRDGVARARHRHRRRGPGDPGRAPRARSPPSSSASAARATRLRACPKGRLFPLTLDELVEAAALLRCIREGVLDRTPMPPRPLDILAQQIVAACVAARPGTRTRCSQRCAARLALPRPRAGGVRRGRRAPHRGAARAAPPRRRRTAACCATQRARLAALLSGGAIPDTADYQVRLEPEGTLVGTVNEDWAIESNARRHLPARQRLLARPAGRARHRARGRRQGPAALAPVLARRGAGPHARARRRDRRPAREQRRRRAREAVSLLRGRVRRGSGRRRRRGQIAEYVEAGRRALGAVPTQRRVVLERFFDESGGMQLVVHAPFGSTHQPRLGAGAAQALLRRLRLRAAGGGQRGGDRPLARPAAQLRARRASSTTCSPTTARDVLDPGAARVADVRDALALERAALAAARALARRQEGPGAAAAHARRRPARGRLPAGARLPRDAAGRPDRGPDGASRSCARRSRTA